MSLTYKVEIAFASNPDATSQTWTDVSAYADLNTGFSITRGRTDAFSHVQVGRLTLTLNNSDGRFTPQNASSPYYPGVQLGKRIRVSAFDGTTSYYRFDGRIDAWPMSWAPVAKYSTVAITASDRLAKLGQAGNLSNIIAEEYLSDSPVAYFMLGDPANSTVAANSSAINNTQAILRGGTGTVTFGNATGPGTDGITAMQLVPTPWNPTSNPNGFFLFANSPGAPFVTGGSFTMEGFISTGVSYSGQRGTIVSVGTNGFEVYSLTMEQDPALVGFHHYTQDGRTDMTWSAPQLADGHTHHVAAVVGMGVANVYVDGVSVGLLSGLPLAISCNTVRVGGTEYQNSPDFFNGTIAQVAVYNSALAASRIQSHYLAGATGFAGERSDQRITRIAGYASISDLALETGLSTISAQDTGGAKAVDLMNAVADTENGVLFADRASANLVFHARTHRYDVASVLTLSAGQYENDLSPTLDDFGVTNDVTVTRADGAAANPVNSTSQAAIGVYTASVTSVDNGDISQLGWWMVNVNGNPVLRWPTVSVDLLTQPALWSAGFGLDIGAKVTLSGLPTQAAASSVDLFIEGYAETVSSVAHSVTFNCSAVTPVWKIGDATYGRIDSTNVIAL